MNDVMRDTFEAHAATMGFDLTRRYLAVPEPWSEYVCPNTGCFWAGWQAATEQGKRQPLSDEELDLMSEKALFCRISRQQFARAIEAAHGITATPQGTRQPPYPEGDVVGPCVCGSWPGGKCLKCPWTPATSAKADQTYTGDDLAMAYKDGYAAGGVSMAQEGDAKDALNQAAIGLAALLEGQSNPVKPTIHEYGQARRALIAVHKAIEASQKGAK